jgi:hypothetical protein
VKDKTLHKVANKKAIEYAKAKNGEEYNDPIFKRVIEETELDFLRGFIAGYRYRENLENVKNIKG